MYSTQVTSSWKLLSLITLLFFMLLAQVLDEADCMLGSGLDPEIHKILRPIQDHESKSDVKRLQTILAISTMAEV